MLSKRQRYALNHSRCDLNEMLAVWQGYGFNEIYLILL
jgi:hypothetical protein